MNTKNIIQKLITQHVLIKKQTQDFYHMIDHNGSWIFDFRKWFLNPEVLDIFCRFFWDTYWHHYPFQVWGIESWWIPFVSWIILEWLKRGKKVNGFYIRKTRKEKWLWNFIEGNIGDEKIFIVDDVLNGGQSLYTIFKALESENKQIFKTFVFVNFGNPNWQNIARNNMIQLEYLFTLWDFWLWDYMNGGFWGSAIIYPRLKKIAHLEQQNLFLDTPKSNPILQENNFFIWWESWDFLSIHKETWDIIWKCILQRTPGHKNILSSPLLVNDELIFWNYDGNMYVLDSKSWKINYVYEKIADYIWSSPCYNEISWDIFIWCEHANATRKWSLVSVNHLTKRKNWEVFFDDFVHCSPEIHSKKDRVICWWNDGKVIGIEASSWKILYKIEIWAPIKWGFCFDEAWDSVYFGTHNWFFYKVNSDTWEIIWNIKTENIIYTKPYLHKNNIFFGWLDKYFYHIDSETGKIIQKVVTWWKIFSQPLYIAKNTIIFASNNGYIYFYNMRKKDVDYMIYHGEKINNKMIYEEKYGFLYVCDHVWWIYKYHIKKYLQ